MCIYEGHRCIYVSKVKFLCLNLWLGEVCTDDANANNVDANNDAQSMIVQGSLVDKPNEPKGLQNTKI